MTNSKRCCDTGQCDQLVVTSDWINSAVNYTVVLGTTATCSQIAARAVTAPPSTRPLSRLLDIYTFRLWH